MKAPEDRLILTDWSLFTLPDAEYHWTATPVTLSLPFPDPVASASGYVPACSPRPALPVLYWPPMNTNNSLLSSHSPLCNSEVLHSLSTGQCFTQLPSFSPSALKEQLAPAPCTWAAAVQVCSSQCWCPGSVFQDICHSFGVF